MLPFWDNLKTSFSEAGADEVWLTSPQFTFHVTSTETPLREIAERTQADFIFTEGFKDAPTPKAVLKKKGEDIHVNGEVLLTTEGSTAQKKSWNCSSTSFNRWGLMQSKGSNKCLGELGLHKKRQT